MQLRGHYLQQLNSIHAELLALGQIVVSQATGTIEALVQRDRSRAVQLIANDGGVNRACDAIQQHIISCIATQQPVASDLRRLLAALDISTELERIADYAKNIAKLTIQSVLPPQGSANVLFTDLTRRTTQTLSTALLALAQHDTIVARSTELLEAAVDTEAAAVRGQLLGLLHADPVAADWSVNHLFSVYMLERIADRATNIAERVIFMVSGETARLNEAPPKSV